MKKVSVAVIGVGAVGIEMLRVIKQRNFPFSALRVFARSSREIEVDGDTYQVETLDEADLTAIDIALFAGTEGEKGAAVRYAEKFIDKGAFVIDNGADFRLCDNVPLVVPEANGESITKDTKLIANPNCTTIQMIVALANIYKLFGLKQIILTSFQATSGGGKSAAEELLTQTREVLDNNQGKNLIELDKFVKEKYEVFPDQIAFNVIPKIGGFSDDNYTSEELKVVHETHKILSNKNIKVNSTCVRVPVFTSHSESIYFTTEKDASLNDIEKALVNSLGVKFFAAADKYPLPLNIEGKDEVFVGRLRRDSFNKNSFCLWAVADNLRKGAATNAVQIAETLLKRKLI